AHSRHGPGRAAGRWNDGDDGCRHTGTGLKPAGAAPARTNHGPDDELPVARGVHVDSPLARAEEPPARPLGAVGLAGCKMNRMTIGRPQVEPKGTQALRQRRASIKPS